MLHPFYRCPLDNEIMGSFEYSEDRMAATVTFPAHKFPYTASVYYQCNVRLCALQDPDCQKVCVIKIFKSFNIFSLVDEHF